MDQDGYFDSLRRRMESLDLRALERGTVVDWAMEGHRIAVEHAYRLPRDGRLGRAYVEANRPVIDHALIAAGVRLAKVLNDALARYRPSAGPVASLRSGVYTDREAAAHVGETATVVGTVAAIFRSKRERLPQLRRRLPAPDIHAPWRSRRPGSGPGGWIRSSGGGSA